MRYLLFWHIRDAELHGRSPEWHEEVASFLAGFEDELAAGSELEWTEVLAPGAQSVVVGPGAELRHGVFDVEGTPLARVWAVRVADRERAVALAAKLAGELDAWVEVRECLPGAQRP